MFTVLCYLNSIVFTSSVLFVLVTNPPIIYLTVFTETIHGILYILLPSLLTYDRLYRIAFHVNLCMSDSFNRIQFVIAYVQHMYPLIMCLVYHWLEYPTVFYRFFAVEILPSYDSFVVRRSLCCTSMNSFFYLDYPSSRCDNITTTLPAVMFVSLLYFLYGSAYDITEIYGISYEMCLLASISISVTYLSLTCREPRWNL
jgi:hypothetical protein